MASGSFSCWSIRWNSQVSTARRRISVSVGRSIPALIPTRKSKSGLSRPTKRDFMARDINQRFDMISAGVQLPSVTSILGGWARIWFFAIATTSGSDGGCGLPDFAIMRMAYRTSSLFRLSNASRQAARGSVEKVCDHLVPYIWIIAPQNAVIPCPIFEPLRVDFVGCCRSAHRSSPILVLLQWK